MRYVTEYETKDGRTRPVESGASAVKKQDGREEHGVKKEEAKKEADK